MQSKHQNFLAFYSVKTPKYQIKYTLLAPKLIKIFKLASPALPAYAIGGQASLQFIQNIANFAPEKKG
jgi:hypothetical protein